MNKTIAAKAKQFKKLKATAKLAEEKATKLREEIITELQKEGVKTVQMDGVQLTLSTPIETRYYQDVFKDKLPKSVYKRLFKPVFDPTLVEGEVLSGAISKELVEECVTVTDGKPRLTITLKET